jgi:hypothetical protein
VNFDVAARIADAVLYEGYVLYPYRASAQKNRVRWQFGIVAPRAFSDATDSDPWWMQTECLVDPLTDAAAIDVRLRFLQVQARGVEQASEPGRFEPVTRMRVGDRDVIGWDEGIVRTHDLPGIALSDSLDQERAVPLSFSAGVETELVADGEGVVRGRIARERWSIDACIRLSATRQGRFIKFRLRLENATGWTAGDTDRDRAMRRSLVSAHLLLCVRDGSFVSMLEPPDELVDAIAGCANVRMWPVLIGTPGQRNVMLSSPIILYDYPAIAPESPQDLCDGTEIDEILALRVMTLTEDEKREARATDDRARDIVDRTDTIPRDVFERLHGAIRQLQPAAAVPGLVEWEALLNPPGTPPPQEDAVDIAGVRVTRGSRVIVRPARRADPIDMFMKDRVARVEGVYRDLEGSTHVAVVLADDPSGDLHAWYGRYLYYRPEELEPLKETTHG